MMPAASNSVEAIDTDVAHVGQLDAFCNFEDGTIPISNRFCGDATCSAVHILCCKALLSCASAVRQCACGAPFCTDRSAVNVAGNSGKEYRTKFRTLWFNLNDSANPALRARVLQGNLTPSVFVRLTPNELASRVRLPTCQPASALMQSDGQHVLPNDVLRRTMVSYSQQPVCCLSMLAAFQAVLLARAAHTQAV